MAETASEVLFERFCALNEFRFERVPASTGRTPDYLLHVGGMAVYIEVKQIDDDANFGTVQTRTPGKHVRSRINDAREQIKYAFERGCPGVLLIYNNLDPFQLFGTERHDFLAGMYGQIEMHISRRGEDPQTFYGRTNQTLREGEKGYVSAVGWLYRNNEGQPAVHLYENAFADVKLDYAALPPSIAFNRVIIEEA
jgi:hypothetical protein